MSNKTKRRATKPKLKILMFNRWVGYNEGGNETHIKELAVFLNKRGHTIDILTTGKSAIEPIKKHIRHIYSVASPKQYFSYSHLRFYYSIKYIFDSFIILNRILKKRKYDVITVHFSLEALIVRAIRAIHKTPYVLVLVGDTDLELIEGKRANNVSQLTKFMADECIPYGYYPEILTKGIDKTRFGPKVDGTALRKKYLSSEKQFLVLSVCRLDPRKNLTTLVKTAKILEKKYPGRIKYVIVGSGVEEESLKRQITVLGLSKTVHMAGSVPSTSDLLPQYYAACDIFALPTLYEGFGYVFSEAMAFGKPVVGTNTSAVPEVIGDVGILVPIKSPDKLSKAIEKLYKDSDFRSSLAKKSIEKSSLWYWDKLIVDYENFIYKAIENFKASNYVMLKELAYFLIDLPKIIFIGLRPMFRVTQSWGSILKK